MLLSFHTISSLCCVTNSPKSGTAQQQAFVVSNLGRDPHSGPGSQRVVVQPILRPRAAGGSQLLFPPPGSLVSSYCRGVVSRARTAGSRGSNLGHKSDLTPSCAGNLRLFHSKSAPRRWSQDQRPRGRGQRPKPSPRRARPPGEGEETERNNKK